MPISPLCSESRRDIRRLILAGAGGCCLCAITACAPEQLSIAESEGRARHELRKAELASDNFDAIVLESQRVPAAWYVVLQQRHDTSDDGQSVVSSSQKSAFVWTNALGLCALPNGASGSCGAGSGWLTEASRLACDAFREAGYPAQKYRMMLFESSNRPGEWVASFTPKGDYLTLCSGVLVTINRETLTSEVLPPGP